MTIIVLTLCGLVLAQFWVIYKLIDRLLVQAKIPSLLPVRTTPPADVTTTPRRPLFSVPIEE